MKIWQREKEAYLRCHVREKDTILHRPAKFGIEDLWREREQIRKIILIREKDNLVNKDMCCLFLLENISLYYIDALISAKDKAIVSQIIPHSSQTPNKTENINSWILYTIFVRKYTEKLWVVFSNILHFFQLTNFNFLVGLKWMNIKFCIFKLVQFDFF